MRHLSLEPTIPFRVSDRGFQIIVVGGGGNGSHVAHGLGRLCYHLRETGGASVNVVLIDGDTFTPTNVGRQLCRPRDVGQNKAKALAARINADYGLRFEAIPEMLDRDLLERLIDGREDPQWSTRTANVIVVGCVDSAAARRDIHACLPRDRSTRSWLWLDVGNHEYTGQVALGSVNTWRGMVGALAVSGLCGALPSPGLVLPDLITPAPLPKATKATTRKARTAAADCAADAAANRQSFGINAVLGSLALEYLTQLTVQRAVTRWRTTVDLLAFVASSDAITPSVLAAACGLDADGLRGTQPSQETIHERSPERPLRQRGQGNAVPGTDRTTRARYDQARLWAAGTPAARGGAGGAARQPRAVAASGADDAHHAAAAVGGADPGAPAGGTPDRRSAGHRAAL